MKTHKIRHLNRNRAFMILVWSLLCFFIAPLLIWFCVAHLRNWTVANQWIRDLPMTGGIIFLSVWGIGMIAITLDIGVAYLTKFLTRRFRGFSSLNRNHWLMAGIWTVTCFGIIPLASLIGSGYYTQDEQRLQKHITDHGGASLPGLPIELWVIGVVLIAISGAGMSGRKGRQN